LFATNKLKLKHKMKSVYRTEIYRMAVYN